MRSTILDRFCLCQAKWLGVRAADYGHMAIIGNTNMGVRRLLTPLFGIQLSYKTGTAEGRLLS